MLHVVFSCVYKCDERVCVSLYCDVCWKYVPIVTLPIESFKSGNTSCSLNVTVVKPLVQIIGFYSKNWKYPGYFILMCN